MLAASALGVSGLATAASFAPPPLPVACVQDAVVLPCERSAWDLGIEAIYVRQASGTNWYLGERVVAGTVTNNGVTTLASLAGDGIQHDPRWAWGFRLEGSYHWGTGSDLTVNWTHFQKKTNIDYLGANNLFSAFIGIPWANNFPNPLVVNGWNVLNDWADARFDQVNIEFGQDVEYGKRVRVRSHSGVTFVRLDHERQVTGFARRTINDGVVPAFNVDLEASAWSKTRYNGVGPRFGQDLSYDVGSGFSVYGRYAVSATAGTSKLEAAHIARQKVANNPVERVGIDQYTNRSKRTIVAGLETRLGVKYTYPMAQGDLIIDAAYQVNAYQGILQQFVGNTFAGLAAQDNNWGYHGASIGLKWIGNA